MKPKVRPKAAPRGLLPYPWLWIGMGLLLIGLWTGTLQKYGAKFYYRLVGPETVPMMPKDYAIRGIDVSFYQGRINWKKVKSHPTQFAFIRATQGIRVSDRHFKRNWEQARAAGLIRGAYHFFTPSRDAGLQADFFISKVTLKSKDLPPVLDVERTEGRSAEDIREGVQLWLSKVEEHYGAVPIIYTNYRFYQRYLKNHFDDYPIWLAHYQENAPDLSAHSSNWTFWQHSERGRVSGIRHLVDLNVFNGDRKALEELCLP